MALDFTALIWDWQDIYKVLFSLFAGFILGFEREWKDKSAGFKTIAIICLGSTLFTILSYKMGMGDSEDATRIASYIVSGIGFLGAGVIFKENGNVNGLTTASIIWIAAAIGMSIGFGQYITATLFLLACFVIIVSGPIINKYLAQNVSKTLTIHLQSESLDHKKEILSNLKKMCRSVKIHQSHFIQNELIITLEIVLIKHNLNDLENYLIQQKDVSEFRY